MPTLHQWDYLMAIGTIFSLLDAYNIGANDVANSWATSVSSRSVTLRQAMLGAAVFEFLGAVTVGARVASTIKNGIIPGSAFEGNAGVQLLAFTCAIVASASWLMFCSWAGFPVSTTYSIISAVAGVGVAVAGADAVQWGWNDGKGLGAIFAGLGMAPAIAAGFGAVLYTIVKVTVLMRKDAVRWAIFTGPFFFFLAAAVSTMSIIYKGAPTLNLSAKSPTTTALAIVLTALVVTILAYLFWVPYVYSKVIKKDYTLKWYHFFMGPLLWKRRAPEDAEIRNSSIPDYRVIQDDAGNISLEATKSAPHSESGDSDEVNSESKTEAGTPKFGTHDLPKEPKKPSILERQIEALDRHPLQEGDWYSPRNLRIIFRYRAVPFIIKTLTYGTSYDIHAAQSGEAGTVEGDRMRAVYAAAKQYPNEVEHSYSFVQVLTACTASFAHGANDISNAVGPWAVIYQAWHTGVVQGKNSVVPVWILAVAAVALVLGLATYGYNIIRVLGNKITYHSPSRGSSMELAAAITVILASQYGLPVSTTMCITGATVGVGLCQGNLKAVNWKAVGWIFLGWVLTIPIVGTLSGCLMGIILNAPRFGA
ncbi:sodium:inorganic phosphate symporter [Cystobasidium minutum MCA 4210]|uniref:sodium:inorganic phosphate symporter n=1 Tax=Cystobasidium minutum MCA 4210 TaxID=1397322 RepID=UPI0034CFAF5D|eukprot:jgi/Rhomi1/61014/CE61013_367